MHRSKNQRVTLENHRPGFWFTWLCAVALVALVSTSANANECIQNLSVRPKTGKIQLTWDAAAGAQSYDIERSPTMDGPYTAVNSVDGQATAFLDDTVEIDVISYYRVQRNPDDASEPCYSELIAGYAPSGRMRLSRVPDVIAQLPDLAEAAIAGAGFTMGEFSEHPTTETTPGDVAQQDPPRNSMVPPGFVVDLGVAVDGSVLSTPIGPNGGTIVSADGRLTLEFPPGALANDTNITVQRIEPSALPAELADLTPEFAYELGPDGLQFPVPLRATVLIDGEANQPDGSIGAPPAVLLTSAAGAPEFLGDLQVNANAGTNTVAASGSLTHFSPLVLRLLVGANVGARPRVTVERLPEQMIVNQAEPVVIGLQVQGIFAFLGTMAVFYRDDSTLPLSFTADPNRVTNNGLVSMGLFSAGGQSFSRTAGDQTCISAGEGLFAPVVITDLSPDDPNGSSLQMIFTGNQVVRCVANQPPVADIVLNAGPDGIAMVGETLFLSAQGSTDPENDPIEFSWSLDLRPAGSSAAIDTPTEANTSFVPDVAGQYAIQLTVTDAAGNSDTVTVFIEVEMVDPPNQPPVFTSLPVITAQVNSQYSYDVSVVALGPVRVEIRSGPPGMEVERPDETVNEYRVEWLPQPGQEGDNAVTLLADGVGGQATQSFTIVVAFGGPVFDPVSNITVTLGFGEELGTLVNYPLPTARDANGPVPVACNPRSGAFFPLGTTPVTCTATDLANIARETEFLVHALLPQARSQMGSGGGTLTTRDGKWRIVANQDTFAGDVMVELSSEVELTPELAQLGATCRTLSVGAVPALPLSVRVTVDKPSEDGDLRVEPVCLIAPDPASNTANVLDNHVLEVNGDDAGALRLA